MRDDGGGRGGRGRGRGGRTGQVMFARGGGPPRPNQPPGPPGPPGMGGPMFPPGGDMMGPMGPMDLPPELLAMGLGPLGTLGPLDPALAGLMGPDFGAGPQGFGPGGGQGGMMGGGMRGPGGPPGGPMGGMMGGGMGMGPMGMGPMGLMGPPMGGMGGPGGMAGPGGPMMGQGGGPGGPGMMGPPGGGGGMMWGGGGGSMGPPSGPRGGPGGQGGGGGPSAAAIASRVQNDYSQNFVDTGCRPQNYLRDSHLTDRYEEYPKLKELIQRKDRQAAAYATPPMFLRADLKQLKLSVDTFGTKFDVILVDPPWEEYVRRAPGLVSDPESWTWQELQALELEAISDTPCFLFLWCGAEEGLEAGRVCMQKWGFRRCEDICWIKTNREGSKRPYLKATNQHPDSILVHTKEHCLMGIKGTVRRATDGHIIHTNVDTDVIVSEEPELGSTRKPEELYAIIERFSNGRRRLELFGEDHNIRPGWVTVGKQLTSSNFNKQAYTDHFRNRDGSVWVQNVMGPKPPPGSVTLVPSDAEIEALRPKSPPDHRGSSMHSH